MNQPQPRTAAEWRVQQRDQQVQDKRREARTLYEAALELAQANEPAADQTARQALDAAASAFWRAEDTGLESATHQEMDDYGRSVRQIFGCQLAYEDGNYYQRCPVAIAHKRIGLSTEHVTGKRLCSICGEDFADCEHSPEELYEVSGGIGPSGYCRVCASEVCAEHDPSGTYRVPPMSIVTQILSVSAVAFVRKPAQAEARITSMPISNDQLRTVLGPAFVPGVPLSCDRCLQPCRGIEEVDLSGARPPSSR